MTAAAVPTPAHVVIVVEENRSQSNIIGNKAAPFINQLAADGAMMAQSFAELHPSEPNYYALFAGNTLVTDNDLSGERRQRRPTSAHNCSGAGYTFAGFAESLPGGGLADLPGGQIRPQACAVGQLHQHPELALASVLRLPAPRLTTPACRPSRW